MTDTPTTPVTPSSYSGKVALEDAEFERQRFEKMYLSGYKSLKAAQAHVSALEKERDALREVLKIGSVGQFAADRLALQGLRHTLISDPANDEFVSALAALTDLMEHIMAARTPAAQQEVHDQ